MSGILTQPPAGDQLQIVPPERWTVERKFQFDEENLAGTPYAVLLVDRQYYLAAGCCFVRHVRQIHEESAAAKLAPVNIPFAPGRESISLHWLRIWRGGEVLDQISSPGQVEFRPGKQADVVIVHHTLQDLRPGDALDVAYSTRASVPRRHFSATIPIRQRVPIREWHLSAIAPKDTPLQSRCPQAGSIEPTVRQLSEGSHYHHWQLQEVPPLELVPHLPSWFQPNPEIQLSNFHSWLEVASEINRLWHQHPACEQTTALAQSFREGSAPDPAPWEAARRACRFVQDEIATTPAAALTLAAVPESTETLDQRQGDCKAKACLLVSLLRSIGVPAAPVLVSCGRMRSVEHALPAPDLFDHAIVRGRIGETDFWVDPCASHEAGPIQATTLPPYHRGLQVSARTKSLCAIPRPDEPANQLIVTEHFIVGGDRRTKLKLSTRASGTEANTLRTKLATGGEEALYAARLAELQKRYPDAVLTEAAPLKDDPEANEITLEEHFEIPDLCANGKNSAIFRPAAICNNLPATIDAAGTRSHPIALSFPCNIRHLTVIDTPWPVDAEEISDRLPGTGFAFSAKLTTEGKRHTLRYAYNTLDDHIIPVDFPSVRLRSDAMRPLLRHILRPPAALASTAPEPKTSKGTRIISERSNEALRERKSNPNAGISMIKPTIGIVGAIALFFVIRASFKEKANKSREAIIEQQIELKAAEPLPPPSPATIELPDNPLALLPPLPPLPGPEKALDDLEFGIGDGTAPADEKTSKPTRGDWKVGN